MPRPRSHGARGFTLVEVMITVVIVAILAGLSIAGYGQYVRRANRTDATAALLRISAGQERFYLQNGRYAGAAELADPPPAGLGMARTAQDYYELELEEHPDGLAVGYLARATARDPGPQAADDDCRAFTIDQSGNRGAADAGGGTGASVTDRCWR